MDISHAEVFTNLINTLLSDFWVILLFGFIHFAISHHKWLKTMAEQGHKKKHDLEDHELIAVVHGAKTIGLGIVVVVCSYMVASLIFFLVPSNPALADTAKSNIWLANIFQLSVAAFMVSGYSLVLSAGGRWLTYLAKLIATAAVLALIGASIATYL
jgi:hypothetical protein